MSSSSNEDGWFNRQQNISVFKNPLAYSDQFIEIEDITFDSIISQDYKTCQADEAEVPLDIGDLDLVNKYVHKIKGGGQAHKMNKKLAFRKVQFHSPYSKIKETAKQYTFYD